MPEDLCNDFCVTELVKVNDFAGPVVVILKIIALPLHNSLLLIHSLIYFVVFKDLFYSRSGKNVIICAISSISNHKETFYYDYY